MDNFEMTLSVWPLYMSRLLAYFAKNGGDLECRPYFLAKVLLARILRSMWDTNNNARALTKYF